MLAYIAGAFAALTAACVAWYLGSYPACPIYCWRADTTECAACRPQESFDICSEVTWIYPSLCRNGSAHWQRGQLLAALPEFADLWRRRPLRVNVEGMNVNHAFALWFTVRAMRPAFIVESGVLSGQSTWILRQAAGADARIFSLDPQVLVKRLRYSDSSDRTTYFLGANFTDFGHMDWARLIPRGRLDETLVMLDDHTAWPTRVAQLLKHGFVHAWFDDNSHFRRGSIAVEYTLNQACAVLPDSARFISYKENVYDEMSWRRISLEAHAGNVALLRRHLGVYFEFPPIFDGCAQDPDPLLREPSQLAELSLPSLREDVYRYAHSHPAYVRLEAAPD